MKSGSGRRDRLILSTHQLHTQGGHHFPSRRPLCAHLTTTATAIATTCTNCCTKCNSATRRRQCTRFTGKYNGTAVILASSPFGRVGARDVRRTCKNGKIQSLGGCHDRESKHGCGRARPSGRHPGPAIISPNIAEHRHNIAEDRPGRRCIKGGLESRGEPVFAIKSH